MNAAALRLTIAFVLGALAAARIRRGSGSSDEGDYEYLSVEGDRWGAQFDWYAEGRAE